MRGQNENLAEVRLLAIDPSRKGFGFAVFEGPDNLLDWGITQQNQKYNRSQSLKRVRKLFLDYRPAVLVVEDFQKNPRRGKRARDLVKEATAVAKGEKIKISRIPFSTVRSFLSGTRGCNKDQIAKAISERLPVLASKLPPPRTIFNSEDSRLSIFDAAALALSFYLVK